MASLMSLPRELRDQIGIHVILAESERPDLNQSFDDLINSRVQYKKPSLEAVCKVVLYLPQDSLKRCLPLLLVNRQLCTETLANLALLAKRPSYSLDIIVLDEVLLLPTWLSVPVLSTSLDIVDVTFRISGSYDARKEFDPEMNRKGLYTRWSHYKGFRGGDGGPPAMSWQVYAILERFIKVGPASEVEDDEMHKHITAKCIRIDFQTPAGVPKDKFVKPLSGHGVFGSRKEKRGGVLDPGYLAEYVAGDLGRMLNTSGDTWFSCGQILYEHLDELVLYRDGTEFQRWDVAEQLGSLKDYPKSPGSVRDYKAYAWQARRARGLKCLEQDTARVTGSCVQ